MKANKALKRLAKIESLMSDVADRFSASAPHLREALKDLKAAVASVKQAVKVQTSPTPAPKKAAPKKATHAAKKVVGKKTAKKRAPQRKAAKAMNSTPLKRAASASPQAMPPAAARIEA